MAGTTLPGVTDAPRLLLLDGHSLAYRAFFALPVENFQTTMGIPTNAVYGFTSMLINQLRDEKPTHVGVAFDVSRKTFRNEAYAEYKAGRSESPTDFKGQVSLIKEVLAALRIPSFGVEGFEADDVIATLATQGRAQGMEVLIATGDRDGPKLIRAAPMRSTAISIAWPRATRGSRTDSIPIWPRSSGHFALIWRPRRTPGSPRGSGRTCSWTQHLRSRHRLRPRRWLPRRPRRPIPSGSCIPPPAMPSAVAPDSQRRTPRRCPPSPRDRSHLAPRSQRPCSSTGTGAAGPSWNSSPPPR